MRIHSIDYSFSNRSLDIFISGCKATPKCRNCHNPELWDFNAGEEYCKNQLDSISKYIADYGSMIDNIFIVGGEPLDQPIEALRHLLRQLSIMHDKPIWLFTRYSLSEVPSNIKHYCTYVKTGKYIPELTSKNNIQYGVKLATSNQQIHKIK